MIRSGELPVGCALVPGCGRGYAVAALASAARRVTGIEISDTAKAACNAHLASAPAGVGGGDGGAPGSAAVVVASEFAACIADDFFTHAPSDGPYDLVYDCTFLCAIPMERRGDWAAQMSALVRPGGELVSLVFPIGDFTGGPPFALSPAIVEGLLAPVGFEPVSLTEVPPEQWARGRKEYLYRWRRKTE
mmetsp:Transcript_27140/g.66581  ORF Transcript_27140/g.66581 Transcript_27140/m.66581 type:complete len:190 (-) Transcript_27140:334-903(-)|eukprot:CAMPEP_0197615396 /NCGR_PEP_ID=MMETSP1326-20131121/60008_1 /TAXON_ID=1155430 /ORGANISM="Genus nov. species nov., Strain RCC2288" /LENGTH=189 /DNA_ID=CAMNT_0043184277 /DNA_START=133 /DNA_END=702 /DNA_ORIENTATION=+